MIIKLCAFGYDKLTHLDAVKKVLSTPVIKPASKIIPLADKMKTMLNATPKQ